MRIVFIGPPGAGKGTQCKRLTQFLEIPHLSTGEMLRGTLGSDTALGRLIASFLDSGRLVPDYLVMRLVLRRLASPDCAGGCLFDGFPRTLVQAQQLDEHLASQDESLELVLNLEVEQDELIDRLLKRAKIESRADDNEATIAERLRVFYTQTSPLLEYYQNRGVLESVDGMQTPDQVFSAIRRVVLARMSEPERAAFGER